MKIQNYKNQLTEPLRQRTLVFIIDQNKKRILLGYKKRGFGVGKINGIGGKKEEGETIEEAAIREGIEEVGIKFLDLVKVATLDFYFPYVDNPKKWNQQVIVFICNKWEGEPTETEEIKPEWFNLDAIPHHRMWSDDIYWFPKVLAGQTINASFLFNRDLEVEDHNVLNFGAWM